MRVAWRLGVLLAGMLAGSMGSLLVRADDNKGTMVDLGGLKSTAPDGWKPMKSASENQVYQFKVRQQGQEGKQDAQLTIHWFKGEGGSASANVQRWKKQFRPPEGKTIEDVAKVHKMDLAGGKVKATYLDIHGTFRTPVFSPGQKSDIRPDTRMLAVVFDTEKGPYFIRLFGPEKTVAAHKKEFDDWLKAFKS